MLDALSGGGDYPDSRGRNRTPSLFGDLALQIKSQVRGYPGKTRKHPPIRPKKEGLAFGATASTTHFCRRLPGHAVFAALQVLHSRPSTDRALLATSLSLIGLF